MTVELKVPSVGESISEVQVGEWLKGEGERVERDEPVVMIETDKVTVELPAPISGVLSEIRVKQGEPASVGDVIGMMEEAEAAQRGGDGKRVAPKAKAEAKPEAKREAKGEEKAEPEPAKREVLVQEKPEEREDAEDEHELVPESIPPHGFARVMPAARRALKERGLSPEEVEPSGPGARLLKEDVQRHVADLDRARTEQQRPAEQGRQEEVVRMSPLRKRIAERLVVSQQTAALLTTFNEVDMTAVMALRKQYQETFQERHAIKLGFMAFFVKACIEALKLVPGVNAEIRGDDIVYRNYYDIGVAIGGGRGLVVPVIRNAERLSFAEIEKSIADFAKRAKDNKLKLDELQGGTFTISNGGVYGSLLSTPIVNPPQSGILGLHAINDRPVARDGQVVIRPMMYVALTYDHRLVDGREAVTFLRRIKDCVEQPSRILLEV
jgi:2-oxoglutarate dehydrogenase E2 component (dihydrolipoamide succinyltransferase)